MLVADAVIRVGSEGVQRQVRREGRAGQQMDIEVGVGTSVLLFQQRDGMVDLAGRRDLAIAPVRLRPGPERGVESRRRVEQVLLVMQVRIPLEGGEHAHVDIQDLERLLADVQLDAVVLVLLRLHHRLVVQNADGSPVMAVVRTAAESDVVVLHPAEPEDGRLHVGIEAMVVELIAARPVPVAESIGT